MLIKSPEFDRILNSELYQITVNNQKPLIKRGSYKIKPYGAVISDIDLAQNVIASPSLLSRLSQIIERIKVKKNFIFVRLHCGMYSDFEFPWTIDGRGDCSYDQKKAEEWFQNLYRKKVMYEKAYKEVEKIIFNKDITIKSLLQIKQIIRPFSEILWDESDIKRGYKEFFGKRYYLVGEMQKGHVTVMRYIFFPYKSPEGCSIDFGLVDRNYIKEPSILHSYYKDDIYRIFKSYKWYLKPEFFPEYLKVISSLENYTGLLNRVKLIDTVKKYKLLSQTEIQFLEKDALLYGKKYNLPLTENGLNEKIKEIAGENREYFRERIQDRFKPEVISYELRSEQAKKGFFDSKSSCPFFQIKVGDFYKLLSIARRALIDPRKLMDCVGSVSSKLKLPIPSLVKSVFGDDTLYIRESENGHTLFSKNEIVSTGNLLQMQKKFVEGWKE